MERTILKHTVALLLIFSTNLVFAENEVPDHKLGLLHGFSIQPALLAKIVTVHVKQKSDGGEADVTNDPGNLALSLSLASPNYRIGETNWGFGYLIEHYSFKANKQIADLGDGNYKPKKLGTSISGKFNYFIPTLFYKFSGEDIDIPHGTMLIGGGIGYGTARIEGTATLGQERRVSSGDPVTAINASATDVFSFLLYWELELNKNHKVGARLSEILFDDAQYKYGVEDFSAFYTYRYVFD